jgi:hypothetical protein
MGLSIGFDPSFTALASTDERRPSEREPDSQRITPITESELPSAESRQRLNSPESTPRLTRVAFTAKFGPDQDGFPLQLIRGDQVTGAESIDVQVIFDNRISQDNQTALLQAQESRDAVSNESQRQQEAAAQSRQETNQAVSTDTGAQVTAPTPGAQATAPTPDAQTTAPTPGTGTTLETTRTTGTTLATAAPDTPTTTEAPVTVDTPVTAGPPATTTPDESRTESGALVDFQV